MRILDLHSHILPEMDDGAKDVEESLELLKMLKQQGVTDVFCTPHFSPGEEEIDGYLERYKKSKALLENAVRDTDLPRIKYGCELFYSYGLGTMEGIKNFTIDGSKFVLIEFGAIRFDEAVCRDIKRIKNEIGVTPIIAHIERYKIFKGYEKLLELVEAGYCYSQVNASSVIKNTFTKTANKLIKRGLVTFIGSDCHSIDYRPPRIREAYQAIAERFGKATATELIKNCEKLLYQIENKK